jgi:hypothetical protein
MRARPYAYTRDVLPQHTHVRAHRAPFTFSHGSKAMRQRCAMTAAPHPPYKFGVRRQSALHHQQGHNHMMAVRAFRRLLRDDARAFCAPQHAHVPPPPRCTARNWRTHPRQPTAPPHHPHTTRAPHRPERRAHACQTPRPLSARRSTPTCLRRRAALLETGALTHVSPQPRRTTHTPLAHLTVRSAARTPAKRRARFLRAAARPRASAAALHC